MNNQLEQTIAKIDLTELLEKLADLPDGGTAEVVFERPGGFDEGFMTSTDRLKALAAEVKRLNHILETIRNMSVYIHEKDPNPDPQFMADFYKTKLGDAVDHARKELEGE